MTLPCKRSSAGPISQARYLLLDQKASKSLKTLTCYQAYEISVYIHYDVKQTQLYCIIHYHLEYANISIMAINIYLELTSINSGIKGTHMRFKGI